MSQKDSDDAGQQLFVANPVPDHDDDRRELDIISISSKIESELQSNKAHNLFERFKTQLDSFISENREFKTKNKQLEM